MNNERLQIIGGICPLCGGGVWYKPKRVMTRPVYGMVNGSIRLMHKKCAMVHGLKEKEK